MSDGPHHVAQTSRRLKWTQRRHEETSLATPPGRRHPPAAACRGPPYLQVWGVCSRPRVSRKLWGTLNITEQLASHIKCKRLQRISNSTNTRLAAGVSTSRSLTPSAVPRAAGPCDGPGTSALALFWARSRAGDYVREDEPGRPPLARVPVWQGDPWARLP